MALLRNAVKFVGRGNQVVMLVDTVAPGSSHGRGSAGGAAPHWVDIHVIDNGPGLPADGLAQAAQPFWRSPSHQNVDGSGLGMTVAEALVTASGGRLDLMPAQPHRLHARVRLPAPAAGS